MSHTSVYQSSIKNIDTLKKVLTEKKISFRDSTKSDLSEKLFSSSPESQAIAFNLENWLYPIIVDTKGAIYYDNFGGKWGSMEKLGEVIQNYNVKVIEENIDFSSFSMNKSIDKDGNLVLEMIEF